MGTFTVNEERWAPLARNSNPKGLNHALQEAWEIELLIPIKLPIKHPKFCGITLALFMAGVTYGVFFEVL